MRIFKKGLSVVMAVLILFVLFSAAVMPLSAQKTENQTVEFSKGTGDYATYIDSNKDYYSLEQDIIASPETNGLLKSDTKSEKGFFLSEDNKSTLSYNVNVSKDTISYFEPECAFGKLSSEVCISLRIDGTVPFADAERIKIFSLWENAGSVREDDFGNQIAPEQQILSGYHFYYLKSSNLSSEPYKFALSAGSHTVEISVVTGEAYFSSLRLAVPNTEISYSELLDTYESNHYGKYAGKTIILEGENALWKNDKVLSPLSDHSDPSVSPSDPKKDKLNYIGGSNWGRVGQTLIWEVDIKPEDAGLFKIGFKYRQNQIANRSVYRMLYIDGKIPFSQGCTIDFPYDSSWKFSEMKDENGNEYLFYLSEGKHSISLEVTLGELLPYVERLQTETGKIGDLYRKIVMITGESVDLNRDYNLFEQIEGFNDTLLSLSENLEEIAKHIKNLSGKESGANVSSVENMIRVLNSMLENPYKAHKYKSSYYSYYCSLAAYVYELTQMPLDIDYLTLSAPEKETTYKKVNFVEKFIFGFTKFLYSYSSDYSSISLDKKDVKNVEIWVNWGRDQAQVLNTLITSKFTPSTGINVNLKLTSATLIQGILSGDGPDCALHLARSEPVNLAMRGALYDLSTFDDYEDVMSAFLKNSGVAYEYMDGCYALPDTETFYMMFCRNDILKELGVSVPKTWDDFLEATATIQRNNFQVNIGGGVANTGTNMLVYATMLAQNGGNLYTKDRKSTDLSSQVALETFSDFCAYYTDYKVPKTADFYNRFRTGLMPIGLQPYTMYMTLSVAAPEIEGKWSMYPIPGKKTEDGSINNCQVPSGTGCSIMADSKNKAATWEFLKWWTSAETQLDYSENVETILGTSGRVATANIEAFSKMSWDSEGLKNMQEQMKHLIDLPELPGGYYMSRIIDQAFYNVISNGENPQDMLLKWSDIANNEISRKRGQYGLN